MSIMSKKEFFAQDMSNLFPIAYISALGGLDIYQIEYGINDSLFCAEGAWIGKKTNPKYQHKLRIYSNINGEAYIKIRGQRYKLCDAIRTIFN